MSECYVEIRNLLYELFVTKSCSDLYPSMAEIQQQRILGTSEACRDFISLLLRILKDRVEFEADFADAKVKKSILHYYQWQLNQGWAKRYENPLLPEDYSEILSEYIVTQWEQGIDALGFIYCVYRYSKMTIFPPQSIEEAIAIAESRLQLRDGSLVKEWDFLLSIKSL